MNIQRIENTICIQKIKYKKSKIQKYKKGKFGVEQSETDEES